MRQRFTTILLGGLMACVGMITLSAGDVAAQGKTRLTVYTAVENDQLAELKQAAEAFEEWSTRRVVPLLRMQHFSFCNSRSSSAVAPS